MGGLTLAQIVTLVFSLAAALLLISIFTYRD
jgi:hypothetical protein